MNQTHGGKGATQKRKGRWGTMMVVMMMMVGVMMGEGVSAFDDPITSFGYTNFSSDIFNASSNAQVIGGVVKLTDAGLASPNQGGSVFFGQRVQVRAFTCLFTYSVSNNSGKPGIRADGLAFVVMNTEGAVVSPPASGLGYGGTSGNTQGLTNSIAVEIDTFINPELGDPEVAHVSIHSRGPLPNSAHENYSIPVPNTYAQFGSFMFGVQYVNITYTPNGNGTLVVTINSLSPMVFNDINLDTYLSLDPLEGSAYVGITGGTHGGGSAALETFMVTEWNYQYLGNFHASNSIVSGIENITAGVGLTFTIQAYDQFGYVMSTNSLPETNQVLSATLVQPDGSEQNATAVYSGSGLYTVYINATISGHASVFVWLNSLPVGVGLLGPGAYGLTVIPAGPFAPNSFPFGFTAGVDTVQVAGVPGTFFVQLRDVFGNNITTDVGSTVVSASVTPIVPSSYSLSIFATYDPTSSYYVASYNITLEGNFTIAVQVAQADTLNNKQMVQVVPAAIDSGTSNLYGVPAIAIAGELQTAKLQLKDVFGNNASNAVANFTIQVSQGATIVSGSIAGCVRGLCQITYNLTVASYDSVYTIVVIVNEDYVNGSHVTTIEVQPAALDPSVTYAYGYGIASGTAGYNAYFYVQLTDSFGNNKTDLLASISSSLTTTGVSITPLPLSSPDPNGLYSYYYNATLATDYTLSINVGPDAISNGVVTVTIGPAEVNAPTTIAYGPGLSGNVVVGVNNWFYVQLRDVFSNNITTKAADTLNVPIQNDALTVDATSTFTAEGMYEVVYNITLASEYTMSISLGETPIYNSEQALTLIPTDIYPWESVTTTIAPGVVAGELNQIQLQLRDVYGNEITDVPNPSGIVVASFNGVNVSVPVNVEYVNSGVYTLSYNATTATSYNLTILVLQSSINGGVYPVQVAPAAAYPPLCLVEGDDVSSSVAGVASSFNVYLYDVFNNLITQPASSDIPVVAIGGQPVNVAFSTELNSFVASYTITQSAVYNLQIQINGTQILSSDLIVAPAPLDVGNSNATGSALDSTPAGLNTSFFIYLLDQYNNLLPDFSGVTSISVTMSFNGTVTTLTPVEQGQATYEVAYSLLVSGIYETTVLINGNNIKGSPFSTSILAGPYNPHGTVTSGLSFNVTAGNLNMFTIELKDIYGNEVTENDIAPGEIAVYFNNTPIDITVSLPSPTVFQVTYNYTTAGSYFMNVTINNTEVGASPSELIEIQPGPVYPLACVAEGNAISQAVVRRRTSFIVVVKDRYGNRHMWAPDPPLISLTADGQPEYWGSSAQLPDGTYNISYTPNAKTTYSMSVTFDGFHIQGSPFTVQANYGNNSVSTLVIVCAVIGSVVAVAVIIGAYLLWRRRKLGYVTLG